MAKILGLDLGTNSIGWAVIDDEKKEILGTGVRIFPEGVEPTSIGKGDNEKSKNAGRRESRQQRRNYYRDKLRRIKLLSVLIDLKMCPLSLDELNIWKKYDKKEGQAGRLFPHSNEFAEWIKLNPYELRSRALKENISLYEFGRILYHFIQRRGFLSSRKGTEDGAIFKGKENMTGIDDTLNQIKDKTLGAFLYSILPKENEPYKTLYDNEGKELRVRARYTLRDMYIAEFEAIWNKQAGHLKLEEITVPSSKIRFIEGSVFNKRNKKKVEQLQKIKGKENVKIEGNKITTYSKMPLKEYLAGQIKEDEDGNLKHKSKESVLFYQRPLRSQKGLLAKCTIEGKKFFDKKMNKWVIAGPTPCPLSHPEFEEYRALQFINNIEYGTKQKLDENQRTQILNLINKKNANFDFENIPKELKLIYEKFNFEDKLKVPGNYTISMLKPLFKENVWEMHKNEIWHCFYSYEDNDKLIEKLSDEKYGLQEKDYDKISKIKLKEGYSSVSLKAIRNITPFLKKGYKYSDAVVLGGVRNAFIKEGYDRWENFADDHEKIERNIIAIVKNKSNKEGDTIKQIKEYLIDNCGFEKEDKSFRKLYHHSQEIEQKEISEQLDKIENLRNPIVQQGLNELRRLINLLLKEHISFDKIKVELGRDLRNSKQGRQKASRRNYENNAKNEEARQKLTEYGLAHSRENIQKYLLFKEIEERAGTVSCPYTNKTISIHALLGKNNEFQIEHIFPRSTSLDDSFGNKTLCEAKFNGLKGNKTPYEFYKENSDPVLWGGAKSWENIEARAFKLLPYSKAKRFTAKKIDESSFIERQLNDTRYISKKAKEILMRVCKDVRVMPGSLTAELRHLWGLNNILQPVQVFDFKNAEIDEDKPLNHWVVFDENNQPVSFHPMSNIKPAIGKNETTILGNINKNIFSSKYIKTKHTVEELPDGEYWKILKLSDSPVNMVKIFIDKPELGENEIIIRGKVEKKKFIYDGLSAKVNAQEEDGTYWAKFKVKKVTFEAPQAKVQPKKAANQLLLYGDVENCRFQSFIFSCKADVGDGKFWALLDLEIETPKFISYKNIKPEVNENQLLIQGSVDEYGYFSSELDYEHRFATNQSKGKYWTLFNIVDIANEFYPVLNTEPLVQGKQKMLEGSVWVDKYTGEIKFDPKKNRDDHRHHAIDAIAIALTEQSYLQKLSTYNANRDEKQRGNKYEKPSFDKPWPDFFNDAKKAAAEILISQKANHRVLTKINKKIVKNGKKYTSKGYAVSGQLHKEFVFGLRQAPDSEKGFHIKKSVESLTTDKQIDKIVDKRIREIIRNAKKEEKILRDELKKLEAAIKKTKTEADEQIVQAQMDEIKQKIKLLYTLPNKNGEPVPIKKVRIKENLGNTEKLKDRKVFAEKKQDYIELNQHVNPRNNHHVAIYKNENGELFEEIVSLWTAVERKKQNLQVINKNPVSGFEFVTSLQINDMFIIDVNEDDINWENNDKRSISRYLYRVQKITSGVYTLTHHLESNIDVDKYKFNPELEPFPKVLRRSKGSLNGIKVKIDILGNITKF